LINNRQSSRRRGRGGQRSQSNGSGGGRGPENGNRIDNRARGNAAQLLEKYKSLARDAQMQGDRVQTEYYLQFADHYFRVLSESRSRFEEQRRQRGEGDDRGEERGEDRSDDRQDDRDDDGDEFDVVPSDHRQQPAQDTRADRARDDRPREDRQREDRQREDRRPRRGEARRDDVRPLRNGQPAHANGHHRDDKDDADIGIEVDRLPPALAPTAEAASDDNAPAPKPRRGRPRRAAAAEEAPVEG